MTAMLTETGPALLNVDTEEGMTSFAWTMAPWDAYVELWTTNEDPELLETVAGLPFLYSDGRDTDLANLGMFAEGYLESGAISKTWPKADRATSLTDQIFLACSVIQQDIAAGRLAWDVNEQTLRATA